MAPHGATPQSPIRTKPELFQALTEAAVLEHQFMCQYLYAAFSLKKSPDATCDAAQFEFVRRWASTIYMIARQEMEHLSIVNSLLTAVGGNPYFGHEDFPTRSRFYSRAALRTKHGEIEGALEPCEIPFVLEKFSLRAARRFACMESPRLADVPPGDRNAVQRWGFHRPGEPCTLIVPPRDEAAPQAEAVPSEVEVGTVQQLYLQIGFGLRNLEASIGEGALFSGHVGGQSEIPSEYQIFLFPIADVGSAIAALNMVTQQGEGLSAPPGFDSHFLNYFEIAREYAGLQDGSPGFEPAKDLPLDPTPESFANPDARLAAAIFNYGYVTLLLMLTGYYGLYRKEQFNRKPTFLTAALEYNSIAPFMTMFVRTMAEILTEIPAGDAKQPARAAPVFNIAAADLKLLGTPPTTKNFYGEAKFYADRLKRLLADIGRLRASKTLPQQVATRLAFLAQNLQRLIANFGYVDEHGIYKPFNPHEPQPEPKRRAEKKGGAA